MLQLLNGRHFTETKKIRKVFLDQLMSKERSEGWIEACHVIVNGVEEEFQVDRISRGPIMRKLHGERTWHIEGL